MFIPCNIRLSALNLARIYNLALANPQAVFVNHELVFGATKAIIGLT